MSEVVETRAVQMSVVTLFVALLLAATFVLATAPHSGSLPAPTERTVYVYHNSTIYVNTTVNVTTPEWSNTTVYVNTTYEQIVYVNTTLVEFVPVVFIANVTFNGVELAAPHDLNISTGAVLWLRLNATCAVPEMIAPACGCSYSFGVNAPFVLLSSAVSDGIATLLVGVPYSAGSYDLAVTGGIVG